MSAINDLLTLRSKLRDRKLEDLPETFLDEIIDDYNNLRESLDKWQALHASLSASLQDGRSKQAELETELDRSRAFAAEAYAETQRIHGLWLAAAETTRNELECKLASKQAELETELDKSRAFAAAAYAETQRIHGLWLAAETTRNELECKLASKQAELETELDRSQAFAAEAYAETQRIHGLWLAAETTRNELECKLASKQAELETALDKSRAFAAEAHAETQRIHGLWLAAETTRNELESKLASAAVMTPELQEEIVWLRLYAVLLSEAVDRKHSRRTAVWRATREHFQKAKQRRLLNSGLQLAWHSDYGLAFDARPVTYDRRIAVISVPKSGTYLLGEILKSIGFLDVGIHGAAWGFQDFRVGSIEEKLSQIAMRTVRLPIEEYVDLIRPGQFVLGHFPHELRVLTAITGFKRILLVRDLRDCFVSYMRYVARLGALSGNAPDWSKLQDKISQMELFAETEGAQFFELVRPLQGWLTDRGTLLVRYEDLMGDHGKTRLAAALKAMVDHIGVFGDGAVPDIARARVVDTLTATGERTNRVEWWSAKVEGRFEELGGTTLNALMGYS